MYRKLSLLLAALIIILSLAACGAQEGPGPVRIIEQTGPEAEAEPEPEPEPEPVPEFVHPLTGEAVWTDISRARPYAIMLNNKEEALPQHSLSEADMIFEMNVEGGITRMMAVFQDVAGAGRIGSVRSARPYFLDLALAFDAVYIHAGGSEQAYSDIRTRGVTNIDGVRGSGEIFYRDKERLKIVSYEHTMFTSSENIETIVPGYNIRHEHKEGFSCPFLFTDRPLSDGSPAREITCNMNSMKTTGFSYDVESRRYRISEYGKEYIDGNSGEQVSKKNILFLGTRYSSIAGDAYGRLKADMSGGSGFYACEGFMVPISWSLSSSTGLVLRAEDGSGLKLAVGDSYICMYDSKAKDAVRIEDPAE